MEGMDEKLNGNYTRAVPRGQNEWMGKFKMAVGDVISIEGYVMKYKYIPKGNRREWVRFGMEGMNCQDC